MNLIRSITIIGSLTGISRILGLIREMLISHILGAGSTMDAFIIAFKFPNLFRRLFAEGSLHAAFIPIFSKYISQNNLEKSMILARGIFSILALVLFFLVIIVLFIAPELVSCISPGFKSTQDRIQLTVDFIRLSFPYIFFISLSALMVGILNAFNYFAAGASAPILLNIVLITILLLNEFVFKFNAGYSLSFGICISGIIQFLWIYIICWKSGFRIYPVKPIINETTKKMAKLMIPGAVGTGIIQINLFLDMVLASFLPVGSLSYLYYADRIIQLPLSIFGIAIGTALLPKLSSLIQLEKEDKMYEIQEKAIKIALKLSFPSAIGLIVLSYHIIFIIYGHGQFGSLEIEATNPTLIAFSVALPAYILNKVLTTIFFAHQNTTKPVKISFICLIINFFLNLILMWDLKQVGMAISTCFASWCNLILLFFSLRKLNLIKFSLSFKKELKYIFFSTIITSLIVWTTSQKISFCFQNRFIFLVQLILVILIGLTSSVILELIIRKVNRNNKYNSFD